MMYIDLSIYHFITAGRWIVWAGGRRGPGGVRHPVVDRRLRRARRYHQPQERSLAGDQLIAQTQYYAAPSWKSVKRIMCQFYKT